MKWQEDLVVDIRIGDPELDNQDLPFGTGSYSWGEITETAGVELAKAKFLNVRNDVKSILEIGVNQFGFTKTWLDNKKDDTTYVGIDVGDRSYLNDPDKLTWTIQDTSSNYDGNVAKFNSFGITEFDFIYIDGYHSINQVLDDWEYTKLLAPGGIVGFHDTNYHPGPHLFTTAINRDKWEVEDVSPKNDWGVVFVRKL
jgi:hypothetical protein